MKRSSTCPIYRLPVVFCDDYEQGNRIAARLAAESGKDRSFEADTKDDGGSVTVIGGTLLFCLYSKDLDLLAHEAVHAASETLKAKGIKGDPADGHEHLTYLVEYYFNEWIRCMGWKVTVTRR